MRPKSDLDPFEDRTRHDSALQCPNVCSEKFKPCNHTVGDPILRSNDLKEKKKLVMKLQYFIASEIFGSVEMGVCRGTERLKEPFLFSAGMTTLARHTHHWWHAKEKGDKLGRVQKRMKEWSKNRTTDLGNKLKEFCLFSLSKKSLLGSCFVVC